jgi:hypothetical protein
MRLPRFAECGTLTPCAICTDDPTAVHSFHMSFVDGPFAEYESIRVRYRARKNKARSRQVGGSVEKSLGGYDELCFDLLARWQVRNRVTHHNVPTMAQVTGECMQKAMEIL